MDTKYTDLKSALGTSAVWIGYDAVKGNGAGYQQHVALQYDMPIVVIDARKEAAYARDHLPGAMSFGWVQRRQ